MLADVADGSKAEVAPLARHVRSNPADSVEKVENRTTPKISRKLIFRRLCRCNALQRRYEGPWSLLCETMWSRTSSRAKRISGPKKFRPSPEKDFFNTITPEADIGRPPRHVRKVSKPEVRLGEPPPR
jgi:hypothetical protein